MYICKVPGPDYGKCYVGNTINEKSRRRQWMCPTSKYGGKKVQEARIKYGPEKFDYVRLEPHIVSDKKASKQYMNMREAFYISAYDSIKNGFNTTRKSSAGNTGGHLSAATIEKRTKTRMANGTYKQTDAAKKAISQALTGITRSQETKDLISAALSGKQKSDEHKLAISKSLLGIQRSEETKAKLRKALSGLKHNVSPEGKARQDAAKHRVSVLVYKDGTEQAFESITAAAGALNIAASTISNSLKNNRPTKSGYTFSITKINAYGQSDMAA